MQTELLIDGAIPREPWERVSRLLNVAESEIARHYTTDTWDEFPAHLYKKNFELSDEYITARQSDFYESWNELEDDIMELITDLLPAGWYCGLVDDDPGTVAIQEVEEDI
jgi:hypothetical protein